jgi:hypothetical protein
MSPDFIISKIIRIMEMLEKLAKELEGWLEAAEATQPTRRKENNRDE